MSWWNAPDEVNGFYIFFLSVEIAGWCQSFAVQVKKLAMMKGLGVGVQQWNLGRIIDSERNWF